MAESSHPKRFPRNRKITGKAESIVLSQRDVYAAWEKVCGSHNAIPRGTVEKILSRAIGLEQNVVTMVLRGFVLFVRDMLDMGCEVSLTGFGTFTVAMTPGGRKFVQWIPNRTFVKMISSTMPDMESGEIV